jgi:hypothetical protein
MNKAKEYIFFLDPKAKQRKAAIQPLFIKQINVKHKQI